jgi:hypothetical protein
MDSTCQPVLFIGTPRFLFCQGQIIREEYLKSIPSKSYALIGTKPPQFYEMIRVDTIQTVGQYLSDLMGAELAHFLCRKCCARRH